ncbi:hypothetical protein EPH_0061770 [Eimeria praecox]|uniref:Uncharacterized protein n=1 Tax=Eimeria praecox TaxID=51316 RepID=U6GXZ4_9EIME|nr:hypothetical protein EPH_0061770 [Eimeria praecox]
MPKGLVKNTARRPRRHRTCKYLAFWRLERNLQLAAQLLLSALAVAFVLLRCYRQVVVVNSPGKEPVRSLAEGEGSGRELPCWDTQPLAGAIDDEFERTMQQRTEDVVRRLVQVTKDFSSVAVLFPLPYNFRIIDLSLGLCIQEAAALSSLLGMQFEGHKAEIIQTAVAEALHAKRACQKHGKKATKAQNMQVSRLLNVLCNSGLKMWCADCLKAINLFMGLCIQEAAALSSLLGMQFEEHKAEIIQTAIEASQYVKENCPKDGKKATKEQNMQVSRLKKLAKKVWDDDPNGSPLTNEMRMTMLNDLLILQGKALELLEAEISSVLQLQRPVTQLAEELADEILERLKCTIYTRRTQPAVPAEEETLEATGLRRQTEMRFGVPKEAPTWPWSSTWSPYSPLLPGPHQAFGRPAYMAGTVEGASSHQAPQNQVGQVWTPISQHSSPSSSFPFTDPQSIAAAAVALLYSSGSQSPPAESHKIARPQTTSTLAGSSGSTLSSLMKGQTGQPMGFPSSSAPSRRPADLHSVEQGVGGSKDSTEGPSGPRSAVSSLLGVQMQEPHQDGDSDSG